MPEIVGVRVRISAFRVGRRGAVAAIVAAVLLFGGALAAQRYSVEIRGAPNGLRDELSRISVVAAGDREFATAAALRRAAAQDIEPIEGALKAAGYYAGKATFSLDASSNPERAKVAFEIVAGPAFKISEYRIVYEDDRNGGRPKTIEEAGLVATGAADGASLQDLQQRFVAVLWNKGYPAARIVARRAEADLQRGEARAVFVFESGPHATFGAIRIDGADATAPLFLEKLKTWDAGERFDRSKLVAYRDRLAATGLFASIDVEPGAPDAEGAAPVLVTLQERKRRTVGIGASYSTAEGPGGRVFFEYRNAFQRGERARSEIAGTGREQSLTFDFNKPLTNFRGSGFASFKFSNETTDAYNARTVETSAGLARKWLKDRLETRGGLALETSKIRTETSEERAYLVSTPASVAWNTEDNLLNPTKGVLAALAVTPYTGTDSFTLAEATARTRVNFGADDVFTVAVRAKVGAALNTSLADLASNKRFYAGGGASVRGY
ncbi:MAG: BamA/TamA family outer membrane protein, partial [Parvularculaceae bacterium]